MKKQILSEEFKRMQELACVINENNNYEPDFTSDAKKHFPELVSEYGTAVEVTLLNSYENFSNMYSNPVKINIKYKDAIESYKTNKKEFFEKLVKETYTEEQEAAGIVTENQLNEEEYSSDKMIELVKMYVDNYFDEGIGAGAVLRKLDEILDGKLDGYDIAFLKGEEDNY